MAYPEINDIIDHASFSVKETGVKANRILA